MQINNIVNQLNNGELTSENINVLFSILENKAKDVTDDEFTAPWTPQAKRADLKLADWLKQNGDGKTFGETATGFAKEYEGVTEDTIRQIVKNDQLNLKTNPVTKVVKDFRKFLVEGDKLSLRVKTVKKESIKLVAVKK